jgi:predicted PurR-regulated permease PerM
MHNMDSQVLYNTYSDCVVTMNHRISLTLRISSVFALGVVFIFALPFSASGNPTTMMYQQQQPVNGYHSQYGMDKSGEYAGGTIASLQNDKNGKPAWVVSGLWKGSLTNMTSLMSSNSGGSNATTTNQKNLPTATFNAIFSMVMLNGSAMHKHEISNFTLTSMSMPNEKIVVYNGTATITMKDGPVNAVPVSIRTMDDNVITIWTDPTKTKNHFGDTPIYGVITDDVLVKK